MVIKRGQSQPLSLKQLFEANFAPRGHLAISRDDFGCDNLRAGGVLLLNIHSRIIQLEIPREPGLLSNVVIY